MRTQLVPDTRHPTNLGKFGPMTSNCPRKTTLLSVASAVLLLATAAFAQDPPLPNTPAPKTGQAPPKQNQPPPKQDQPPAAKEKGQTPIRITTRTVVVP